MGKKIPYPANMCIQLSTRSSLQYTFSNCAVNSWTCYSVWLKICFFLSTLPWTLSQLDKCISPDIYQRPCLFRNNSSPLNGHSKKITAFIFCQFFPFKLQEAWDSSIHRITRFLALEMHKNVRILEKKATIKADTVRLRRSVICPT